VCSRDYGGCSARTIASPNESRFSTAFLNLILQVVNSNFAYIARLPRRVLLYVIDKNSVLDFRDREHISNRIMDCHVGVIPIQFNIARIPEHIENMRIFSDTLGLINKHYAKIDISSQWCCAQFFLFLFFFFLLPQVPARRKVQ